MRRFVEPPPSARCISCNGLLSLKKVDTTRRLIGIHTNIFACSTCAREQSVAIRQDIYASCPGVPLRASVG